MTSNPERAMLLYAELASIASRKQQPIGRDRFLILTGLAATHAGWPDVAARCQELIAARAPRHLITHYPSFAHALRDDEFAPFVRQTERFCTPERAEHLLTEMGMTIHEPTDDQTAGDIAFALLTDQSPPTPLAD